MLVGLVAGLMARGIFFGAAWRWCLKNARIDPRVIPAGWPQKLEDM